MADDEGYPAREVLAAWGLTAAERCSRLSVGLINRTFLVEGAGEKLILQCLHPIFSGRLHFDIEAVTSHLAAKGLRTPRLVPTRDGRLWCESQGEVWRVQTFLEGEVFSEMRDPALAHKAGRAVARFHEALADLRHDFHFERAGVHDLSLHLSRLRQALAQAESSGQPELLRVVPLAAEVLAHAGGLPALPALPRRIVHGDLKLTNLLFDEEGLDVALIDLDTLAHGTLATELGDAFRSWCNPQGESSPTAEVDPALFAAAVEGYAEGSRGFVCDEEIASLRPGTEVIALELASRFCLDAFEDRYFGWDRGRFDSRREHNLVRTQSQLSLSRSLRARASELDRVVQRAYGPG